MAGVVTVNGTALSSYGVTYVEGWSGAIETEYSATALPGLDYLYRFDVGAVKPRVIRLGLRVEPASVAARGAAIDTLLALFPRNQQLTLTFDDDSGKEARGYVTAESVTAEEPGQSFVNPTAIVSFIITCYDPAKYATSNTVTTVTSNTQIPTGTLPHGGVIKIVGLAGGTENPTITYKDGAGNTEQTFSITYTIAENDYVEIDLDNKTVKKSVSSVISNAMDTWSSGDFFLIDPKDYSTTTPPSLSCSAGTCTLTHRKKWRS